VLKFWSVEYYTIVTLLSIVSCCCGVDVSYKRKQNNPCVLQPYLAVDMTSKLHEVSSKNLSRTFVSTPIEDRTKIAFVHKPRVREVFNSAFGNIYSWTIQGFGGNLGSTLDDIDQLLTRTYNFVDIQSCPLLLMLKIKFYQAPSQSRQNSPTVNKFWEYSIGVVVFP